MYAESGKQEPNEYKNKKREAKRSEKKKHNTHQLKMKIVLFIAARLTMATTTTHVRTWCCCCLPLFSTNPFVIHAILPIHSSFLKLCFFFLLLTARALACRLHHILSSFTWYCRRFCMCLMMFYAYYFVFICLVLLLVYRVCTTTISIL